MINEKIMLTLINKMVTNTPWILKFNNMCKGFKAGNEYKNNANFIVIIVVIIIVILVYTSTEVKVFTTTSANNPFKSKSTLNFPPNMSYNSLVNFSCNLHILCTYLKLISLAN